MAGNGRSESYDKEDGRLNCLRSAKVDSLWNTTTSVSSIEPGLHFKLIIVNYSHFTTDVMLAQIFFTQSNHYAVILLVSKHTHLNTPVKEQ